MVKLHIQHSSLEEEKKLNTLGFLMTSIIAKIDTASCVTSEVANIIIKEKKKLQAHVQTRH